MSQKAKMILAVAGFALLLVGAVVAYNALSGRIEPGADLPETQAQAAEGTQAQPKAQTQGGEAWSGADFTVTDAQGKSIKLSDMQGKPVVLNFWASWCPPCRQEMPEFNQAHGELGDEIIFMMVDLTDGRRETVKIASQFVQDQGYGFPIYFDTEGKAADAYGITGIPATFFIDGEGRIVSSQVGAMSGAALRAGIEGIQP